jgi:hypothetical protein
MSPRLLRFSPVSLAIIRRRAVRRLIDARALACPRLLPDLRFRRQRCSLGQLLIGRMRPSHLRLQHTAGRIYAASVFMYSRDALLSASRPAPFSPRVVGGARKQAVE